MFTKYKSRAWWMATAFQYAEGIIQEYTLYCSEQISIWHREMRAAVDAAFAPAGDARLVIQYLADFEASNEGFEHEPVFV